MKCHTPGKTERTGVQDRSNARKYAVDVWSRNTDGSDQADSYIRVLEYPGPLFAGRSKKFAHCSDIFSIADSDVVQALYEFVTEQQRLGEHGIFRDVEKPSYWRSRFYSAALKDYMRFLQQFKYEEKLWAAHNTEFTAPEELAEALPTRSSIPGKTQKRNGVSRAQGHGLHDLPQSSFSISSQILSHWPRRQAAFLKAVCSER